MFHISYTPKLLDDIFLLNKTRLYIENAIPENASAENKPEITYCEIMKY